MIKSQAGAKSAARWVLKQRWASGKMLFGCGARQA